MGKVHDFTKRVEAVAEKVIEEVKEDIEEIVNKEPPLTNTENADASKETENDGVSIELGKASKK